MSDNANTALITATDPTATDHIASNDTPKTNEKQGTKYEIRPHRGRKLCPICRETGIKHMRRTRANNDNNKGEAIYVWFTHYDVKDKWFDEKGRRRYRVKRYCYLGREFNTEQMMQKLERPLNPANYQEAFKSLRDDIIRFVENEIMTRKHLRSERLAKKIQDDVIQKYMEW